MGKKHNVPEVPELQVVYQPIVNGVPKDLFVMLQFATKELFWLWYQRAKPRIYMLQITGDYYDNTLSSGVSEFKER